MPKRTIFLILGLFVVVVILLYVALSSGNPSSQQSAPQQKTTQTSPAPVIGHTQLSLSPAQLVVPPSSQSGSIDVLINANGDKVTGVQLAMTFDPTIITNVVVTPGSFLPQATALLNSVDQQKGTVFSAFVLPPSQKAVTGTGTVATITFTKTVKVGTTTLSFGDQTKVTAEGVTVSVLKQATGGTITQGTQTPATQ